MERSRLPGRYALMRWSACRLQHGGPPCRLAVLGGFTSQAGVLDCSSPLRLPRSEAGFEFALRNATS